jgi:5-methylcytosine-specific restriction endonuclease McrA
MARFARYRGIGKVDHQILEADRLLLGERVARAIARENRRKPGSQRRRRLAIVARARQSSETAVQRRRRRSVPDRARKVRSLARRDGDACWYCLRLFDDELVHTVDHVVPVTAGGTSTLDNLRLACHECNGRRGRQSRPTERGAFGGRRGAP